MPIFSATPSMDRLTGQLYHLPAIIGQMGLSIANAQKLFDENYVENVIKLLGLIMTLANDDKGIKSAEVKSLLEALAPSRYQFTETTLDFSADLAETIDVGAQVGFGVGTPAITVNAAFSMGYGRDYRAAARITTVLHAIAASPDMAKGLIERAGTIHDKSLTMPDMAKVEENIWNRVSEAYTLLTNVKVEPPKVEPPEDEGEGTVVAGGGAAT